MNSLMRALSAILACATHFPVAAEAQVVASLPDTQAVPIAIGEVAPPSSEVPAPADGYIRLPANTPVDLEIVGTLSSKTSKIDEMFPIRLRSPIAIDGKVIVPAGTMGEGQVVHAAKARGLGKAGELILAARYLACGDLHLVLRGFRLGEAGRDKSGAIIAAVAVGGVVAMPLMFVSGGESIVPAGTPGHARLMSPVDVRIEPTPVCIAPAAAALPPSDMTVASPTTPIVQSK